MIGYDNVCLLVMNMPLTAVQEHKMIRMLLNVSTDLFTVIDGLCFCLIPRTNYEKK
jgi:hypothetical protein